MIEINEALNGDEGDDVKQLVINYMKMRNQCLNFRNLYKLLGKEDMLADSTKLLDTNLIPQIGRDLEERNKELTLESLKKQGQAYKDFNQHILNLFEGNQNDKVNTELTADTDEVQAFKKLNKQIDSYVYFD